MKSTFLILALIMFSCQNSTHKNTGQSPKIQKLAPEKTVVVKDTFLVGDVNNDKINDTAFVSLKRNVATDDIVCEEKNCDINIEFKNNIPKISFDQSLGVYIEKTADLDNDKANEIILFSRTYQGWWNDISVFSFKNGSWNEIAKTKGFLAEDKDFKNRILYENGKYYLIGDDILKEDKNGHFKSLKVKI